MQMTQTFTGVASARGTPRPVRRAAALALTLALSLPCMAHAGDDLNAVKARGLLICGVSDDIPGFSEKDASGQWQGMNIDFCRAVAAAVLGKPDKVKFVPLQASTRFPALLQSKSVDILMRNTTWTLVREAALKAQFPGILIYDGQGFLVPKADRVKTLKGLNGATVCVEKGTTHEGRLTQYLSRRGIDVKPLVLDSAGDAAQAFFSGRCQAYTSDATQLAAMRSRAPDGAKRYTILPDRISKEPMGPVIRSGDAEWATVVRWVINVIVAAEELGITQKTLESDTKEAHDDALWRQLAIYDDTVVRSLGIPRDWAPRIIQAVGNYEEMYERNLGSGSKLGIERGLNRQWTDGGLLYALPVE